MGKFEDKIMDVRMGKEKKHLIKNLKKHLHVAEFRQHLKTLKKEQPNKGQRKVELQEQKKIRIYHTPKLHKTNNCLMVECKHDWRILEDGVVKRWYCTKCKRIEHDRSPLQQMVGDRVASIMFRVAVIGISFVFLLLIIAVGLL